MDGEPDPAAKVRIPLATLNRHGLVAGATGTGKTKTLQVMAEQLSAAGVPVFLADIKGDVSGMAAPAQPSEKLTARTAAIGQDWKPTAYPVEFYALGGKGTGIPVRATVTSFGPILLSKVLDLSDVQSSSLEPGLPLRRQERPAAAGHQGPARGDPVPDLGRGRGPAAEPRRPVQGRPRACCCAS